VFLYHLGRSQKLPKLTVIGFQLTLLFVAVTIAAAVFALVRYDSELVAVDWLHGGAEAFLTLSNACIVAGLLRSKSQEPVNNSYDEEILGQ
jgi:hypothetical protein